MILLDTHALIWWATGQRHLLSDSAFNSIAQETAHVASAISSWEITLLVNKGRIAFSTDVKSWLDLVESIETFRFIPIDRDIATLAASLPGEFHKDPADRMIVATALKFGMPLVSADEKIRSYPHVRSVW